jgi:hypothetical protein
VIGDLEAALLGPPLRDETGHTFQGTPHRLRLPEMIDVLAPEVVDHESCAVMDLGSQAGDHDVGDGNAVPLELGEERIESAAGRDPEVRTSFVGAHHLGERRTPSALPSRL